MSLQRIRTAASIILALAAGGWAAPAPAAIQILDNKVSGDLYLVNVWGSGTTGADIFPEVESLATAISQDGEIVGFARSAMPVVGFRASLLANGQYRGTTITQPGLNLRTVRPFGVNDNDVVVGEAATTTAPNALYAFKEDPAISNGSSPNFTDGPGKKLVDPTSTALGINAGGQIVGQNNLSQAYRYTPGTPGSFLTLSAPSTATAINDAGTFVGVREVSGQERAFLHDGTVQDLLPAVQAASEATAINNDGDVAGSIAVPRGGMGNVKNEAFLLRSGAAAHEGLGLVAGYDESFARGVNVERWVVGEATGMGQARTAWLWADGQIFDLSTQLEWDWVDPQAPDSEKQVGWTRLLAATAVNDAGTIVGQGKYQLIQGSQWVEQDRAFVLSVTGFAALPEPGTLLLLLGGLAAICTVRWRRTGAQRVAA